MRFLRFFIQIFLLFFLCLWIVTPCIGSSSSSDVLCLSGENQPRLRRRYENFSSRAVAETAQARAYLSPAVFLGTLRSVLMQRDGTVRAWFAVDTILKMSNDTGMGNKRRSTRASWTTNYTRVSYSRNKYIRDFVSLPAVRPRNPSVLYQSTYTRAMGLLSSVNRTMPTNVPNWNVYRGPHLLSTFKRSTRTTLSQKPEDTEVVYYRSGKCIIEVNQDNLKLGGQYLVFGVPVRRHSWPSLSATALPIPNDKRTLRAVKKILCKGCAKPPSIEDLQNVRAEEGSRARFHCHLAGNPIPWVEWYKDGRRITNRSRIRVKTKRRTSRLVIRRVRTIDRGVYECRAGNVVGKGPVSVTTTLTVRKKRRKTTTALPITTTTSSTSTSTQSSPWTTEPCERSDFCNNGGTCIFYKDVRELVCHCADGFVGLRCEYKNVRLGEVRNLDSDRLLIAIVILFLVFFFLNWACLGICWLCCFRTQVNWGKFRDMASLREFFKKSFSVEDSESVDVALELTSSQDSPNGNKN